MRSMFNDMETATIRRQGALAAKFNPAAVSAGAIDSPGRTAGLFIATHPGRVEARTTKLHVAGLSMSMSVRCPGC